jgi:crotonobetainyl-CoA:carnitine CoA-transferase CaiB-like acyl-CoA transferase
MMHETSYIMNTPHEPERSRAGIAHAHQAAPYGIYRTADGGAVAVCAFNGVEGVRSLAKALGISDRIDAHLSERGIRTHRDDIAEAIARALARLTTEQAARVISGSGCWVTPVRSVREALADPAVAASQLVRDFHSSVAGSHRAVTEPLYMSATPLEREVPAPAFGEHSRQILCELGYDDSLAEELIARGTVYVTP